jgi:ABC-type transport system involved in cytochrome c biogenesis permease component
MNKVMTVALNEIKQQIRRKAIWAGMFVFLLLSVFTFGARSGSDLIYVFYIIGGQVGWFIYYVILVLCADRILSDKKSNCFQIICTTTLKKSQYYIGRTLGNLILFGVISFIFYVITNIVFQLENHTPLLMPFDKNFVFYFFVHYFCGVFLFVLAAVLYSTSFTIIFKNAITSIVVCVIYSLTYLFFGSMNLYEYYMDIFEGGCNYYKILTHIYLIPHEYSINMNVSYLTIIGFTIQKAFLSIFLILLIMVAFYILGSFLFSKSEIKSNRLGIKDIFNKISSYKPNLNKSVKPKKGTSLLIAKEMKINGWGFIIAEFVLFLVFYIVDMRIHFRFKNIILFNLSIMFFEIVVSLMAALYSANLIYNSGDISLLMTCGKSPFKLIFTKYLALIGVLMLAGIIEVSICVFTSYNNYSLAFFMALIPPVLLLSSVAVLFTLFLKNTGAGLAVTIIIITVELAFGDEIFKTHIPKYYNELFSVYDTTFMYGSDLWLINRFIMIGASIIIWVVIFMLLKFRRRNLIR